MRIRKKNGQYILTLKEPHPKDCSRPTILNSRRSRKLVEGKPIEKAHTQNQLKKLDVQIEDLINIMAVLTTVRRENEDEDKLIRTWIIAEYNDNEDYELELEVKNFDEDKKTFKALLEEHHITKRRTPNKIERFYISLKN